MKPKKRRKTLPIIKSLIIIDAGKDNPDKRDTYLPLNKERLQPIKHKNPVLNILELTENRDQLLKYFYKKTNPREKIVSKFQNARMLLKKQE